MIADENQSRNFDGAQPVRVLHRFQIAVHHKLAVLAPHLAVKLPRHLAVIDRVIVRVWAVLVEIREITLAPGRDHVIGGVAVLLVIFPVAK